MQLSGFIKFQWNLVALFQYVWASTSVTGSECAWDGTGEALIYRWLRTQTLCVQLPVGDFSLLRCKDSSWPFLQ